MRADHVEQLRSAIERAALTPNAFVEWIDDDETQHVVVGIGHREAEGSVANLSGGGFVVLKDTDPCDFRTVAPAVVDTPPTAATLLDGHNGNRLIATVRTEISIVGEIPDSSVTILNPTFPPDDPDKFRCAESCQPPTDGADFGKCPVCGLLVAFIWRNGIRGVYQCKGTKGT